MRAGLFTKVLNHIRTFVLTDMQLFAAHIVNNMVWQRVIAVIPILVILN
jgi:hypothetical protein